jgi:hypothetical protein
MNTSSCSSDKPSSMRNIRRRSVRAHGASDRETGVHAEHPLEKRTCTRNFRWRRTCTRNFRRRSGGAHGGAHRVSAGEAGVREFILRTARRQDAFPRLRRMFAKPRALPSGCLPGYISAVAEDVRNGNRREGAGAGRIGQEHRSAGGEAPASDQTGASLRAGGHMRADDAAPLEGADGRTRVSARSPNGGVTRIRSYELCTENDRMFRWMYHDERAGVFSGCMLNKTIECLLFWKRVPNGPG